MMEETGWKHYLRLILNIVIPLTGWLLICLLGPKLLKFFMPFVIGWVIAMIANPLVRFLERRVKLVRRHSSIVIVAAALALVIGLLYLLVSRTFVLLRQFIIDLPGLYAGIEGDVARSMEQLEHLFDFMPDSIQQSWAQFGNNLGSYMGTVVEKIASPTVEAAGTVAKSLPAMLVYTVVTILSAYFFIVDRDRILAAIKAHMPQWAGRYGLYLKGEVRHLIGGYFMAQFKIMAVVWLILTVGFIVLGVGGEYAFAAGLLLIYVLTQVTRQIVQPKLVGDSMGLPPLLTLFLLYLGFKADGIAGMILAVPIGLLFVNLYHYGAFKDITDSLSVLVRDIDRFRRKEE